MDFKIYKKIVDAEVEAFNNIYADISKEIELNSNIIEEHNQSLKHRIDINEDNKRLLRNHMWLKYQLPFVDINEMIRKYINMIKYKEIYFQDKYVVEKLKCISNFNKKTEEIDKLKVKNSELKSVLAGIHNLSPEHFAYSSIEALKNVIHPEVIYSSLESYSNRIPHSLYIHEVCAFPHNVETDVRYISEKLVMLFESIFEREILKWSHPEYYEKTYKPSIQRLFKRN